MTNSCNIPKHLVSSISWPDMGNYDGEMWSKPPPLYPFDEWCQILGRVLNQFWKFLMAFAVKGGWVSRTFNVFSKQIFKKKTLKMIPWHVLYTMWALCYKDIVVVVIRKNQLQKKEWVKNWWKLVPFRPRGGVWCSVANAIKNFHIFLKTSLRNAVRSMKSEKLSPLSSWKRFLIILSMVSKEPVPLKTVSEKNTSVLTLVHVGERQEGLCRKQQRLKAEDGISQKICGHISCPPPYPPFHLPLLALHDRPAGRDKGYQHLNEASSWGAHREPGQPSGLREASDFNLILQFMYNF